jgi:Cu+-exporting ATPase
VIEQLKSRGLKVVLLSGDNRRTCATIARELGVERILAEVLPAGKVAEIQALRAQGERVAMVGDGINDAAALASADVGIAIGTGADIAIEAAGVVLMSGDLEGLLAALELSQATMRNIRQNLFCSLIYNAVGITLGAAGFLTPIAASAAMSLSSVSVLLNAQRLKSAKKLSAAKGRSWVPELHLNNLRGCLRGNEGLD